jgi:hypothetical protein
VPQNGINNTGVMFPSKQTEIIRFGEKEIEPNTKTMLVNERPERVTRRQPEAPNRN